VAEHALELRISLNLLLNAGLEELLDRDSALIGGLLDPRRDFVGKTDFERLHDLSSLLQTADKIVSVTLRLWKKGELWDPEKLTMQAT